MTEGGIEGGRDGGRVGTTWSTIRQAREQEETQVSRRLKTTTTLLPQSEQLFMQCEALD